VAAVPGSLSSSGSCLVTAAGPLGSLLLVHLMPGQHRQYILLTAWCRCNHLQMVVGSLKR
jgi:predicted nucleic acid-binding Zn finger protein